MKFALPSLFIPCVGLLLAFPQLAWSQTVTVSTRDALVKAVGQARPGTTVLIAPGNYEGGLHFTGLRGEPGKPIVLAAADKQRPPVFQGRTSGFHLTNPAFVELRHLVVSGSSGNGINIDDGGSHDSPARQVVLHGLTVRDIGPDGNRDGIKLSGLDDFRVEDCTLERWGRSGSAIDMVGCHNGEITGCTFRFQSDLAANGVQTKGGSQHIVVRRCRFENAGSRAVNIGGSTGPPYFRPKGVSYEAKDITVEDCTFVGASAPICFVGVDGAVVRYNTIYRPGRYVLRILQESMGSEFVPCRNGVFSNNLIVFRSDELRGAVNIGSGTAPASFTFAGNHWFCLDRPDRSSRLDLPAKESEGVYGKDPEFENAEEGNLSLRKTSPVQDAGVRPPQS